MKDQMLGKELYSPFEAYRILYLAIRSIPGFRRAKTDKQLTDDFRERLMLAVTKVNGCALCSYAHTQMALESGMTGSEIEAFLAGEFSDAPAAEMPAILFAQHYADCRGKPSQAAWQEIEKIYGEPQAQAILGAIRLIMAGNAYGIPAGAIKGRFQKQPELIDRRSHLSYELAMLLSVLVSLPISLVHAGLTTLFRRPIGV